MKKLLSFLVVAMFAITASAQVTWNLKGGLGISSCRYSDGGNEDGKTHFVGKIGAGLEYPLSSNFSLMPSAEFALKGAKWAFTEEYESYEDKLDIYYFQIPVLAAYRFNLTDRLNLVLKAGPYFAFGMAGSGKAKYEYNGESESQSLDIFKDLGAKRFEAGLDFGIDFEFQRFVVGAEYEFGLTPLAKEEGKDGFELKNSAFYVTVGYKF
ncbi:porin family protein [uncultured Duncaniella sp.]|uniref:porin family protein n=1 Tax=uncultured Duncaniella sp. TaxID=2768039 RepID=UPI0026757FE1|nr:porin family protein [uncultured Duncaniella sp.]